MAMSGKGGESATRVSEEIKNVFWLRRLLNARPTCHLWVITARLCVGFRSFPKRKRQIAPRDRMDARCDVERLITANDAREPAWDDRLAITRREYERYAPLQEQVHDRKDCSVTHIEMHNGAVDDGLRPCRRNSRLMPGALGNAGSAMKRPRSVPAAGR